MTPHLLPGFTIAQLLGLGIDLRAREFMRQLTMYPGGSGRVREAFKCRCSRPEEPCKSGR